MGRPDGGAGHGHDELPDFAQVGDHGDVAGRDLDGGRAHPAGERPLGARRDGLVLGRGRVPGRQRFRSEEHTSELQSQFHLVCRLLLEKKKKINSSYHRNTKTKKKAERNINYVFLFLLYSISIPIFFSFFFFFFFNDTATTEIYTLSLHDALPISSAVVRATFKQVGVARPGPVREGEPVHPN